MKNLNNIRRPQIVFLLFSFLLCCLSCKKQDNWLNIKNNKSDVTPQSLQDLQAVLDNSQVFNGYGTLFGELGTDNVYIPDANLDGEDPTSRNAYLWLKDIYQGTVANDWYFAYQTVEYANIVLDALGKITPSSNQQSQFNLIRGEALFFRCYAFYQIAQLYCKPYSSATAQNDLGIPLRLTSDVNQKSTRASVSETYSQIINDLKTAVALLPQNSLYQTRPNSNVVNALLAKVFLSMADYTNAFYYSDLALKANNTLLDYNSIKVSTSNTFPSFAAKNPEIIFYAYCYGIDAIGSFKSASGRIAPDLYSAYETNDLRKTAFFAPDDNTGLYRFKGSYSVKAYLFCGIANDELFLIRAECQARAGNIQASLADLNQLLQNRYQKGSFTPFNTGDQLTLLKRIIIERRKEMPFTGNLRWEDLRRLNMDSRFVVTLQRTYHGVDYTLLPNDKRYVLPLPNDEINLDGLTQNPR